MTTYELIKSIPDGKRNVLIQSGIIPEQWVRYMRIYEWVLQECRKGIARMDAYCGASEKFFTSEANVRKIVARMEKRFCQ